MSLDDFLKGIAAFDKGLTDFTTATVQEESREQLAQINNQFGNDFTNPERQKAVDTLAADLNSRLMQAGANPGEAAAAAGQIGLTEFQNRTFAFREQQLDSQIAAATIRARAAAADVGTKNLDFEIKKQVHQKRFVDDFRDQNNETVAKLKSSKTARAILQRGVTNPTNAQAIRPLLAKQLQPGNLTDAEQAAFSGRSGVLNWAKGTWKDLIEGTGPMTPKDQKNLQEYLDIISESNIGEFRKRKEEYVKEYGQEMAAIGIDPNKFANKIDMVKFVAPSERLRRTVDQRQKLLNSYDSTLENPTARGIDVNSADGKKQIKLFTRKRNELKIMQEIEKGRLKRLRSLGGL